jgi:hypothetical protein
MRLLKNNFQNGSNKESLLKYHQQTTVVEDFLQQLLVEIDVENVF